MPDRCKSFICHTYRKRGGGGVLVFLEVGFGRNAGVLAKANDISEIRWIRGPKGAELWVNYSVRHYIVNRYSFYAPRW